MITITLPDDSQREFREPITVAALAQSIGSGLARQALAAEVTIPYAPARLVDTGFQIEQDARVKIVTAKDADGLALIRHSTAHLLAYAVKSLFPEAQVTIGPVIEDGFYYDFSYKRPFTLEDLPAIEKKMVELAQKDEVVVREEWQRDTAAAFFESIGEHYKAQIIASIPTNETISLYRQGDFVDLCRGPHVPRTGQLKVFKLLKVAGAYWRGDSKNEMLSRIYGTAWATQAEQAAYLYRCAEAEKRDHRKLGRELNLFHFQEEAPGVAFWHPKGLQLWQQVEQYMRAVYQEHGYEEVKAPHILDLSLWKKTGHWDNYREHIFTMDAENRTYGLKPMNCPGHVQIFNAALRSYRDLPLRYGEFGLCHRNEPSGALHGMFRVRGFTQDDGHIFCTPAQLQDECARFTAVLQKVYQDFGFEDILYKVALRPEKRIGSDAVWDQAENALITSLKATGCDFTVVPGEGAFYGPKIEYTLKDALGRQWQCGTLQVDFFMPVRLGAEYVDADDQRRVPIMLHRAVLGSLERFIGMLIEHHAGAMPAWLAPIQVMVCCISEPSAAYASQIMQSLKAQGFRVKADLRGEKITYKIREHSLQKIPYIIIVGDKERAAGVVTVRVRGGRDLGTLTLADFSAYLAERVAQRHEVENSPDPALIQEASPS